MTPRLSPKQRRFLFYLAEGNIASTAAKAAGLKESTARYHLDVIYTTLKARNVTNAVAIALRLKLID